MTQLDKARAGIITPEMREVARSEIVDAELLRERIATGRVVLPGNKNHQFHAIGIGEGLRTKINVNLGTSQEHISLDEEIKKLEIAVELGADSVMDLSTGGDLDRIRRELLSRCPVLFGSVPIYDTVMQLLNEGNTIYELTSDRLFRTIEKHAADGVDFITVHCGVTRRTIAHLERKKRIAGIVSRGGSILSAWMKNRNCENPLYEEFDRLLEIAKKYDVTLSLGDGLRPGAISDASDASQIDELVTLGELCERAWEKGIQVMVEGPGHVPLDQIEANVVMQKRVCKGAPFYVLGPLPLDIAPGYDHIAGAIGGAIAAAAGADFLCYLTPAEHLRLPTVEDAREGIIASKIAAHAADIVKGIKGARERDDEMSRRRKLLDWEGMFRLALDPEKARKMKMESEAYAKEFCSMCGTFCSIHISNISEKKTR
ncbi:MAG: phosphomethylpyrimidine synthase ThiC [Acidobacteriota bacterium]